MKLIFRSAQSNDLKSKTIQFHKEGWAMGFVEGWFFFLNLNLN